MYTRDIKSDFSASWIAAPEELLVQFDRFRVEEFPDASYLWGREYVRQHLMRIFTARETPTHAFLHFICDNSFDLYLNGTCIANDVHDFFCDTVATHFKPGENLLWIRAYQTDTPDSFTSAIIGGIRWTYANGEEDELVTDDLFSDRRLVNFWETEEPTGWESQPSEARNTGHVAVPHHPIAIKRSCCFRKKFFCDRPVKKAYLYASAQGCYEPHLNGSLVTDALFMPSSTDKIKEYQRFDVTSLIHQGENVIGAMTGNGWYNCLAYGRIFANLPSLLMELQLEYEDGNTETVVTDESWHVAPSPLIDNDLQYGERYDARLEIDGWDTATCDDCNWMFARVLSPAPFAELWEQNYPPVRPMQEHSCRYLAEIEPGVWLYDIGTNIAGCVRITFKNPRRGQRFLIQCCERLRKDGTPETGAYGAVFYQQDTQKGGRAEWSLRNLNVYVAKGKAEETYMARFAYTGFRYIYVSGMDARPSEMDICGVEFHNDMKEIGRFSSSDQSLTRLWTAVTRAWKNNAFNGPTDCPTREKNFWNGDMQIFAHAACWYMDVHSMLARWTDVGRKMQPGPYGWEDEEYETAWTLYQFFGDKEILRVKYPDMIALIEKRREFDGMILPEKPHSPYNDWLNPTGQNLSKEFFSGCWYLRMLDTISRVADALGDTKKRDELRHAFEVGCKEFNRRHYNFETAEYDEHIQSALVLPLASGILPESERQRAGDTLNRYLVENDYALTTGFQATRYLPEVLTCAGHLDTVIKLFHRTEFPSWNYVLDTGATAMTESWWGMEDPDFSISMSHFSLGAVVCFFFEYLAGIRVRECGPGFSHIVLKPHFHPEIGDCSVRYQTPHGEIVSEWHFENGEPVWHYEIPDGIDVEILED